MLTLSARKRRRLRPVSSGLRIRTDVIVPALLALAACGSERTPARRDVILVTIDTLRADRVGCYGDSQASTPVLDRLAADGVRFESASATTPLTLPSHASLMTGRYPSSHGVRHNGLFALAGHELTLAEILQAEGYRTGAVIGAFVLSRAFGLDQGFDDYDDAIELTPAGDRVDNVSLGSERRAAAVTDRGIAWLQRQPPEQPLFLWLHYFDPHAAYAPPPTVAARVADPYRGEIAYVDGELGRLLDSLRELGRAEEPLLVVTSDHGESLDEHGEPTHGLFVYEATIRVPMLMSGPGLPRGRVAPEVVSLIDVLPTVTGLLGLATPNGVEGVDLGPLLATDHGALSSRPGVVSESLSSHFDYGWAPLYALRDERYKLIDAPTRELYDLERDPGELYNLIASPDAERAEAMLSSLRAQLRSGAATAGGDGVDAETAERLESLGYLGVGTATAALPDPTATTAHDPKTRITMYRAFREANYLARAGELDEALTRMQAIRLEEPANPYVLMTLSNLHASTGDLAASRQALLDLLERSPRNCRALAGMARLERHVGSAVPLQIDRYREALDCNPTDAELWADLAAVQVDAADPVIAAGAIASLERAVDLAPWKHAYRTRLTTLLLEADRAPDAEAAWQSLLRLDDRSVAARTALGNLDLRAGRDQEALGWFESVVAIDPSDTTARANLASLNFRAHRYGDALEHFDALVAAGRTSPELELDRIEAMIRAGRVQAAATAARECSRAARARLPSRLEAIATALEGDGAAETAAAVRQLAAAAR